MISDNAQTFKAAARTIQKVLCHPKVKQHFLDVHVEWTFNLEKAPWQGGMFERMIKTMKECLKRIIGRAKFSYEELMTTLCEVEMIVNSRPLTYQSPDDIEEPLTPSHFLIGRRILTLPEIPTKSDEDYNPALNHSDLSRRSKHLNKVMDHFWKRWKNEYLLELRSFHQFKLAKRKHIKVGQIVLVQSENRPRGLWKLARVEELVESADGEIRGARVKTKSGEHTIILNRPVQALYPLEVSSSVIGSDQLSSQSDSQGSDDCEANSENSKLQIRYLSEMSNRSKSSTGRPMQQATIRSMQHFRDNILEHELAD